MRKFKVLAIVIVVLASLVCGYLYYSMAVINPRVVKEITSNPDGERAGIVDCLRFPVAANYQPIICAKAIRFLLVSTADGGAN